MWALCHTLLRWFHKVLSQSIGLRILWTDNNGFDTSPFHVHLVLGAASCVEWWSSISFDSVWKHMSCKHLVDVWYDSLGTVLLVNPTSGYVVYSSIMTSRYSPLGNGPQETISVHCQGRSGSLVGFRGSHVGTYMVAWQARQFLILCPPFCQVE